MYSKKAWIHGNSIKQIKKGIRSCLGVRRINSWSFIDLDIIQEELKNSTESRFSYKNKVYLLIR